MIPRREGPDLRGLSLEDEAKKADLTCKLRDFGTVLELGFSQSFHWIEQIKAIRRLGSGKEERNGDADITKVSQYKRLFSSQVNAELLFSQDTQWPLVAEVLLVRILSGQTSQVALSQASSTQKLEGCPVALPARKVNDRFS